MVESHRTHYYRATCSWAGSTAAGYEDYERAHAGACPPVDASLKLSADPAFRGDAARLNPEQLVVLAAASCQLLTFLAVAARARIDVRRYDDDAKAEMSEHEQPVRLTAIRLRPRIVVAASDGPDKDRLRHLVQLAHQQCYIANSLCCPITVEPTFEVLRSYAFGDTEPAEQRLALLAEIFEPTSRAFLATHGAGAQLAVDLGCGPGHTTRLLAAVTGAGRTVGLDWSPSFLAAAGRDHPAGLEFVDHDLTRLPFPVAGQGADVGYARYLLAHLPHQAAAVHGWLSQLRSGGTLLLEENDAIDTDHPALAEYLARGEELLAARGATMYAGPALARLATSMPATIVTNQVQRIDVPGHQAAEMFALNLSVWRTDPALGKGSAALDRLADELGQLAHARSDAQVTWHLRQLALRVDCPH